MFSANAFYFMLTLVGFFALRRVRFGISSGELEILFKSPLVPSVSVLAPAYNEGLLIRESVRSMLSLRHPKQELIVINDGSTDDTLQRLIEEFRLFRSVRVPLAKIPTGPVRAVYESRDPISLIVIDKENGGKADALNCGINYARNDLIAAVDADSIFERDALLLMSYPFLERPEDTVAVGGIIRIANNCKIQHGRITGIRVPDRLLPRIQVVEYLRAFLGGRVALSYAKSLLLISGAFGVFRRDAVLLINGFLPNSLGEDLELVIRLHRYRRDHHLPCNVEFVADPVCWTEAPESWRVLFRQRIRWQRGCMESLLIHRKLIGNPKYGSVGLLGLPYFLIYEALGPVMELIGYCFTSVGLTFSFIPIESALSFLAVSVLFGILLSVSSIVLEEFTLQRYPKANDIWKLLGAAVVENLGYRQITMTWRLLAILEMLRKQHSSWGVMLRTGFKNA